MEHHEEKEKSYDFVYYLVGLVSGLFTGAVLDVGFKYVVLGGVLGLLTAALFLRVLVKNRGDI
jgi:hypothetical protein